MKLYIKYMVSMRCKLIVRDELIKLGFKNPVVDLGVAEIDGELLPAQMEIMKRNLKKTGLELLDDNKSILIERIKTLVIEMIHYDEHLPKVKYSEFISEKLNYDYNYLSNVFSEVKGTTIQHYIILNKIEKVKELLLYDELSLSEISFKLHYSSVAHLSNQFKKITGLTPSFFKKIRSKRTDLENL